MGPAHLTDLAFAPDGGAIACAVGDAGGEVRLYHVSGDSRSAPLIFKPRYGFLLFSLAFSPGGDTIAACGENGTLHLWKPGENSDPRTVQLGTGNLRSVAYSQDGRLIAVASTHTRAAPADDFIALLRPSDGRILWRVNAHPGGATCLAFSAGGKELVSAGLDGTIKRWRVTSSARSE
jgi:WD40 repeat protein